MAVVHITGLPNSVQKPKLIFKFKEILAKCKIRKFWLSELADMRGCNFKEAKIEFQTNEDACEARRKLNRFYFSMNNQTSQLSAVIFKENSLGRSPSPHRNERSRRSNNYSSRHDNFERQYSRERDRSRSPIYNTTSEVDIELELLKKQRMIVEEERRLLLERKKLELIKEFGASASEEFERLDQLLERSQDRKLVRERDREPSRERDGNIGRLLDRHYGRERAHLDRDIGRLLNRHYGREHTHWDRDRERDLDRDRYRNRDLDRERSRDHSRGRDRRSRPTRVARSRTPPQTGINTRPISTLPKFIYPCRLIMAQMKPMIVKKSEDGEKNAVHRLVNATLRRRIAMALQDEDEYRTSDEILQIYRDLYPKETDEEFIMSTLKKIRMCHWVKRPNDTSSAEESPNRSPKQDVARSIAGESPNSNKMKKAKSEEVNKNDIHQAQETQIKQVNDKAVKVEVKSHIEEVKEEKTNEKPINDVNVKVKDEEQMRKKDIEEVTEKVIEEEMTEEVNEETKEDNMMADEESNNVGLEADGDVSTVELMIDGPDEDWVVDGTDWYDEEDSKDAEELLGQAS